MSSPATLAAPSPSIVIQLGQIVNFNDLKSRFQVLEKKDTHTSEKQWNKTFTLGSIVLGCLAAFAYTQARQYAAIGLGILALGSALKSRVTVEIPTPAYTKQCQDIKDLFKGVASELRTTWQVASNLIVGIINEQKYATVEEANLATSELVKAYKAGKSTSWFVNNDPFTKAKEDEKPWRSSFKSLDPFAETISKYSMELLKEDKELHPVVLQELKTVYAESVRVVNGTSPADPKKVYVENKVIGEQANARVMSQPWPALELKV